MILQTAHNCLCPKTAGVGSSTLMTRMRIKWSQKMDGWMDLTVLFTIMRQLLLCHAAFVLFLFWFCESLACSFVCLLIYSDLFFYTLYLSSASFVVTFKKLLCKSFFTFLLILTLSHPGFVNNNFCCVLCIALWENNEDWHAVDRDKSVLRVSEQWLSVQPWRSHAGGLCDSSEVMCGSSDLLQHQVMIIWANQTYEPDGIYPGTQQTVSSSVACLFSWRFASVRAGDEHQHPQWPHPAQSEETWRDGLQDPSWYGSSWSTSDHQPRNTTPLPGPVFWSFCHFSRHFGIFLFLPGGMFRFVSGANFFGEIVEWCGYAVAAWSLPSFAFAFFTICSIGPRACHHHRYLYNPTGIHHSYLWDPT